MPLPLLIILFFMIFAALAGFVYYGVVFVRVLMTNRHLPTARDGRCITPESPPDRDAVVAIIVPAHNEQDVIADLIASLRAQTWPGIHVMLVLDRCTDATERITREGIAGDPRFTVLLNEHCPEDWAGKTHAVHRGVQSMPAAAQADYLLFADADTTFHPDAVTATLNLLHDRNLDMLSLLTTLSRDTWFERIVQPAAGFELVRQFPLDYVNRQDAGRAFANGQFMLFRREAYDAIGGHEAVHDALLEDLAFARRMARPKERRSVGVLVADGMVKCHMYRSWSAFVRGWTRIFTEAARQKPPRLRKSARRVLLSGVVLPAAAIVTALIGAAMLATDTEAPFAWLALGSGVAAILQTALTLLLIYRNQGARAIDIIAWPVGAWRVAAILRNAARDLEGGVATAWGGREYAREVRS